MSLTYKLIRTEMLPLGFATNVINSTTLSVSFSHLESVFYIFLHFLPLKMTRRRVKTFEV